MIGAAIADVEGGIRWNGFWKFFVGLSDVLSRKCFGSIMSLLIGRSLVGRDGAQSFGDC